MNLFEDIINTLTRGSLANAQNAQTDVEQRKENLREQQRRSDADFIQHTTEMGALPVVNGVVKEPMYNPGNPTLGAPPTNGAIMRPADPARTVTWKSHDGTPVSIELPTEEAQKHKFEWEKIMNQMSPAETAYNQEQGVRAARGETAMSIAKAAGPNQGRQAVADTNVAGREAVADTNVAGRQAVTDATVAGRQGVADTNAASRASGVKSTHITVAPDGTQSNLTVYNDGSTEETPLDAKGQPKTTGALSPAAQGVQSRFEVMQQNRLRAAQAAQQKAHDAHQTAEQQAWDQAQKYQDILSTPDTPGILGSAPPMFQDPDKPGSKPQKLNAAWRTILKGRLQKAKDLALSHQNAARNIRQQLGVGEFAPGSATPPAAQPAAPAAQPAAPGGDKVHVKTSQGIGWIPRANLAAAKLADSKLEEIP